MVGVNFGNPFTGCTGTYSVFWFSHGDISIKQTPYPLYGAFVSDQKIDVERENVVYGCIGGFTGVHIKGRVNLIPYGSVGCTCNQLNDNLVSFVECSFDNKVSGSTFDFSTANSITLTQFISFGYCFSFNCAFSVLICLGGDTETCVSNNLPYTTIVSGNTGNDNLCTSANYPLSPGTYSMTINFAGNNLLTGPNGYNFPNAGISIQPSAAGTGDVPSDGYIGFQAAFSSSDATCGARK